MPIATVAPLPQVSLEDEMRTFHVPSKAARGIGLREREGGSDNDGEETFA